VIVTITIRDNETQDTATGEFATEDSDLYIWEEGNFSCDCNRQIFFAEWRKEAEQDVACGQSRYSIEARDKGTQEVIYSEFNEEEPLAKMDAAQTPAV